MLLFQWSAFILNLLRELLAFSQLIYREIVPFSETTAKGKRQKAKKIEKEKGNDKENWKNHNTHFFSVVCQEAKQ